MCICSSSFQVLLNAMQQQEENTAVRLAALRALLEAVGFIEANMQVESDRSAVMNLVCANTQFGASKVKGEISFLCKKENKSSRQNC